MPSDDELYKVHKCILKPDGMFEKQYTVTHSNQVMNELKDVEKFMR